MTSPLLRLGHKVVAVDESAAILDHVVGARTVVSTIETLELDEVFDAVMLGSHLINVPDIGLRSAFLRCCRRHLTDDGYVLIERHPPGWFDAAVEFDHTADGITHRLRDLHRPRPGLVAATMEYRAVGKAWTQSFRTQRVDDQQLDGALADAGLILRDSLTDDGTWIRAEARAGPPM